MRTQQQGAGLIQVTLLLAMAALCLLASVKLLPVYWQDYTVSRIIASVSDKPDKRKKILNSTRPTKVAASVLERFFYLNEIRHVPLTNLKASSAPQHVTITLDYETKIHFVYNLDFLLTFKHSLELKRGQ